MRSPWFFLCFFRHGYRRYRDSRDFFRCRHWTLKRSAWRRLPPQMAIFCGVALGRHGRPGNDLEHGGRSWTTTWNMVDVGCIKKTCETYGKHPRNLENSWDFTFDFTGHVEGLSSVGDIVDDLDFGTTITVTITTWGIQLQNNNIAEWWSWLISMGVGPCKFDHCKNQTAKPQIQGL